MRCKNANKSWSDETRNSGKCVAYTERQTSIAAGHVVIVDHVTSSVGATTLVENSNDKKHVAR